MDDNVGEIVDRVGAGREAWVCIVSSRELIVNSSKSLRTLATMWLLLALFCLSSGRCLVCCFPSSLHEAGVKFAGRPVKLMLSVSSCAHDQVAPRSFACGNAAGAGCATLLGRQQQHTKQVEYAMSFLRS